jgi:hypothetical protein
MLGCTDRGLDSTSRRRLLAKKHNYWLTASITGRRFTRFVPLGHLFRIQDPLKSWNTQTAQCSRPFTLYICSFLFKLNYTIPVHIISKPPFAEQWGTKETRGELESSTYRQPQYTLPESRPQRPRAACLAHLLTFLFQLTKQKKSHST